MVSEQDDRRALERTVLPHARDDLAKQPVGVVELVDVRRIGALPQRIEWRIVTVGPEHERKMRNAEVYEPEHRMGGADRPGSKRVGLLHQRALECRKRRILE